MKKSAKFKKNSINGLFINFLLILSAGILFFGVITVVVFIYRTEQTSWQERQTETAKGIAQSITQYISQGQNHLDWIKATSINHSQETYPTIQEIFTRIPDINEVYYRSPDGTQYSYYNDGSPIIQKLIENQKPTWYYYASAGNYEVSNIYSQAKHSPFIIITSQKTASDFIAIRLKANTIISRLQQAQIGANGAIYLVDATGAIMASSNISEEITGASPINDDIYKASFFNKNSAWYGEYLNFKGTSVAGVSVPIANTKWSILTEVPTYTVYHSSLVIMVILILLVFSIGILFIALQAGKVQRLFVTPLRTLQSGAALIGGGNYNIQLPMLEIQEFDELRSSLNSMARQLKDREDSLLKQQKNLSDEISQRANIENELRILNDELEQRVNDRTSELMQINKQLRTEILAKELTQTRFQTLVEQTPAVTYISRFNPQLEILFISPQVRELLGWSAEELIQNPENFINCIYPEDASRFLGSIRSQLSDHQPRHLEYRMIHKSGEVIWVQDNTIQLPHTPGDIPSFQGVIININIRKVTEERLLYTAFHDTLTGLYNRSFLYKELEGLIAQGNINSAEFYALLHLDVDRFKVINDSLGHRFGDRLLISIADRLQTCLSPDAVLGRLGGDEFAILLKSDQPEQVATRIAERILAEMRVPITLDERIVYATVSIGIVINSNEYSDPSDLMRDVDIAMYRAKARGRSCYEIFTKPLRDQLINRHKLEDLMRSALENHEFHLYYQPIVQLKENRLVGFEALIRWKSPQHGLISPTEFLPLAEETGLIYQIDRWVMHTACQQLKTWQNRYPAAQGITVSVNVSGSLLQHADVVEIIAATLQETQISPADLKIELTESVFVSTGDEMVNLLNQIRSLGIELQIDDFGTGYSSLSYVQRFPINAIKIDRSFISRIDAKESGTEIVQTILTLAHELGLETVAEGIETPDQFKWLRAANCEFGQGFLMNKPMDSDSADHLLSCIPSSCSG